ncbi:MAG: hypothetical protein K2G70_04515 [Turicibacter sp.]|nr:hypothetical protein [Turicibacter sp.]
MMNKKDIETIELKLIQMIEEHALSEDDYNLITKYLDKVKNDLKKK